MGVTAFEKWFHLNFKDDIESGIHYLYKCVIDAVPDSVIWDYLEETGDTKYTKETFEKVVRLILDKFK